MSEMQMGQVVTAILVVIVVVGAIAIAVPAFKNYVIPLIKGNELSPEKEENAINNVDVFANNIRACMKAASSDCICDGFPEYPAVFPGKPILVVNHIENRLILNLTYNDNVLKGAEIEGVKMSAVTADKAGIPFSVKKLVDFRYEPTRFVQEGYVNKAAQINSKAIISAYLYKKSNSELFMIIGKEGEKATAIENMKKCA
ncbi:MAG: hypothetical protein WC475_04920 [Candidatus Paceibacterota bacterium]